MRRPVRLGVVAVVGVVVVVVAMGWLLSPRAGAGLQNKTPSARWRHTDAPRAPPSMAREPAKQQQAAPSTAHGRAPWASVLLDEGDTCTFRRFAVEDVHFWFAVEDTLHSATYIESQEAQNVAFWQSALREGRDATGRCFAVDVGANGGFFSLLARADGCDVLAIDAQPRCLQRLESAAAVNGFDSRGLSTRWTAVSDVANWTTTVGATRCSGLWAVRDSAWINEESESTVQVTSSTLAALVEAWQPELARDAAGASIAALKIDAEGSEIAVLASALPLLRAKVIQAILLEFVPDRINKVSPPATITSTLTDMYHAGYRCGPIGSELVTLEDVISILDPARDAETNLNWRCVLTL